MGSRFRPYLTFWVVAVVALAADLATKWLVVRHLPFNSYFPEAAGAGPIQLLPRLWLVHVGNKGAAWGLGSEYDVRPFLVLLALAVLFFVWRWRAPLLRELRGGQLNVSEWGTRLQGEGIFAEQIRALFRATTRRAGLNHEHHPLSTAAFRRPGGEQLSLF